MGRLNEKVYPASSKHCGKVCSAEEVLLRRTKAEQNQNHQDRDNTLWWALAAGQDQPVSLLLSIISGD